MIKGPLTIVFPPGFFLQNVTTDEVTSSPDATSDDDKEHSIDSDHELTTLTNNYWNWRLKQEPERSTKYGNYMYNDKLESFKYDVYTERVVSLS